MSAAHATFPLFLRLEGRRVLVVGGGAMAAQRVAQLADAGARVVVVAPAVREDIPARAAEVHRRPFAERDLDGTWFAVAAATPEVNRAVAQAADARRIFVNAVDDLASASAWCGGVVRREGVVVALSTEARAPALAGLLREALDAVLPVDLERWLAEAERLRPEWKAARVPMAERRPRLLEALNALYERRGTRPRPTDENASYAPTLTPALSRPAGEGAENTPGSLRPSLSPAGGEGQGEGAVQHAQEHP